MAELLTKEDLEDNPEKPVESWTESDKLNWKRILMLEQKEIYVEMERPKIVSLIDKQIQKIEQEISSL